MTTKNETFNFTENPLSTNWDVAQAGGLKGTATGANAVNSSGFAVSSWKESNYNFDDDQSSQITVASLTAYDMPGVAIRYASTGGGVGYVGYYDNGDSRFYIKRYSAGAAAATLRQTNSFTMANGDTLKLSIVGTTLQAFKNGVQIGADLVVTGADIVTGGQPGIMYRFANSNVTMLTAWEGVDAVSAGPAIVSVDDMTPEEGSTLVVTGTALKASGSSTATIGGVSQTITTQSATVPELTVALGTLKFGTTYNLVITDSAAAASNSFALTSLQPAAGNGFVDVGTPNADTSIRLTSIADAVSGDQVEWENSALVTIYSDLTWDADDSVTSFSVRIWTTGDGYGPWTEQTINAASSSTSGRRKSLFARLFRRFGI